jgi:hypothetical protein
MDETECGSHSSLGRGTAAHEGSALRHRRESKDRHRAEHQGYLQNC